MGLARGRMAGRPAGRVDIENHTHLTNETLRVSMIKEVFAGIPHMLCFLDVKKIENSGVARGGRRSGF